MASESTHLLTRVPSEADGPNCLAGKPKILSNTGKVYVYWQRVATILRVANHECDSPTGFGDPLALA